MAIPNLGKAAANNKQAEKEAAEKQKREIAEKLKREIASKQGKATVGSTHPQLSAGVK